MNGEVHIEFAAALIVNGHVTPIGTCPGGIYSSAPFGSARTWRHDDARLGQRVTLGIQLIAATGVFGPHPRLRPIPADRTLSSVTVSAGVYTPIPRSEYVFPPRPAELEGFDEITGGRVVADARHNHPVHLTISRSDLDLSVETIAPGILTVYVDGRRWRRLETWDWQARSRTFLLDPGTHAGGVKLHAGQRVTVRFVATAFLAAGGWQAEIAR